LGTIYYSIYFDYGKIYNVMISIVFILSESLLASIKISNCDINFHKLNFISILAISMINYYVEI